MDDYLFPGDELEAASQRADARAIDDHNKTDASQAHAMVGFRLWQALRELGAVHGRMLVTGIDPHELAQLPRDQVQVWDRDGLGVLVADIPADRRSISYDLDDDLRDDLHDDLSEGMREGPAESLVDQPGSVYDVVILNAHLADVTVHHPGLLDHFVQSHHVSVLTGLSRTRPGGFFAALLPREVLDNPNPGVREAITLLGDVLGSVRFPSGALRNVAGCDNPTDLILVRRRTDHDIPTEQGAFLQVQHLPPAGRDPGRHEHLNRYYAEQPWRILGELDARPVLGGPPRLSVQPHDRPLAEQLSRALRQIVRSARSQDLTAGPGPAWAEGPQPSREPPRRTEPPRGPQIDL